MSSRGRKRATPDEGVNFALERLRDGQDGRAGSLSNVIARVSALERAMKAGADRPSPRAAMDAAYHFLTAMAGDRPGYEEAIRALYAKDAARFKALSRNWPSGIRDHALALAAPAFA